MPPYPLFTGGIMVIRDRELIDREVTYFCTRPNMTFTIRCAKKIILDGEVVKVPAIRLEFERHRSKTRDAETIQLMEEKLEEPKWNKLFHRAPEEAEIKRAAETAREIADAKKKILAKRGPVEPQPATSFEKFLKDKKSSPDVRLNSGMIGITTPNAPQSTHDSS